jgi:hypothetical protein
LIDRLFLGIIGRRRRRKGGAENRVRAARRKPERTKNM